MGNGNKKNYSKNIINTIFTRLLLKLFLSGFTGSMAPEKIGEISRIALRALVAGVFVGILNACVAGENKQNDSNA